MNFYLLQIIDFAKLSDMLGYHAGYAVASGHVIAAKDEMSAREIAVYGQYGNSGETWWMSQALTSCELMEAGEEPRIILSCLPTG